MALQKSSIQSRKPNQKLRQAITKSSKSAHKFPDETGRFEHRNRTEIIGLLYCDGITDEVHYLSNCKNSEIRNELLDHFVKSEKISINFCKQNFLKLFRRVKMMTCYQKQESYV